MFQSSKRNITIATSVLLVCGVAEIQAAFGDDDLHPTDCWVATDGIGRTIPDHQETGDRKPEKYVGVFYFVWVGNHTEKVYDISKILKQPEGERSWGPEGDTHFGCEPEYGYFHSSDPWVIRRDMQMLANADVDFIFIDVTNALIYEKTVEQLLSIIKEIHEEGIPAPRVTFVTNAKSGKTINRIYDTFYASRNFKGLWFEWAGKPLIFGKPNDSALSKEASEFFTIKQSWAWTAAKTQPNHWQWLDTYPQDFGWDESPNIPDQLPVAAASHASNSMGKSFHQGIQPQVNRVYTTKDTNRGLHFEEQWERVHEIDPKVVMISGWNEWIAARFIKKDNTDIFAGRSPMKDGTYFVDVFTSEFSRDIAPMRGGYTDNYYYQMVGHIRRFKGLQAARDRPEPRDIKIDGQFKDWGDLPAIYVDPPGDTMHRNHRGTDPKIIYTNNFGRNDIRTVHVVEGTEHVHFKITTTNSLTPHTDNYWMVGLVDTDQNKKTGWQGYDLALNWKTDSDSLSSCAKWKDGSWHITGQIALAYHGNEMEISIPNSYFPREFGQSFDFKWTDNVRLKSVESLFLEGDVAPDRRFAFRY